METKPAKSSEDLSGLILVAEDSLDEQASISAQLESIGLSADMVPNGREAVEAAVNKHYALILMNCELPEMDGYTATRAIRKAELSRGRRTPVVAITGAGAEIEQEAYLDAGLDDCLSKPFDEDDLEDLINRWIPPRVLATFSRPSHRSGSGAKSAGLKLVSGVVPSVSGVGGDSEPGAHDDSGQASSPAESFDHAVPSAHSEASASLSLEDSAQDLNHPEPTSAEKPAAETVSMQDGSPSPAALESAQLDSAPTLQDLSTALEGWAQRPQAVSKAASEKALVRKLLVRKLLVRKLLVRKLLVRKLLVRKVLLLETSPQSPRS